MRVAITAASGQLGSAAVAAAVTEIGPDNVVGLARTPAKAQHLGVEIRPGNYDDLAGLTASLAGIDRVLLISGFDPPEQRIGQHRNVISAARSAGVRRIVYTSILGPEDGTAFSPIVQSNRRTEQDVRESGLDWVIGRNGIYIEPDVEYIDTYRERGEIANSAADGRCAYTTRPELAYAYARMLTGSAQVGTTYRLGGEPLSQAELAEYLNQAFGRSIRYRELSVEEFRQERVADLGEFLGTVIAGIYEGIRGGAYDVGSDFEAAAGRPHQRWADYFAALGRAHTLDR